MSAHSETQTGHELTYNQCVDAGEKLVQYLSMDDNRAEQAIRAERGVNMRSTFLQQADLARNGWDSTSDDAANFSDNLGFWEEHPAITYSLSNMPLWKDGAYKIRRWHAATTGECDVAVNPSAGYLLALATKSPEEARKDTEEYVKRIKNAPLPALHFWSDLAFLTWQKRCDADQQSLKALKHIFRCDIKNPRTQKVIHAILAPKSKTGPESKLYRFEASSDDGKSLIATPNGAGVVWMLLQHRAQLGWKIIKRVTVMTETEGTEKGPHLWFELEDQD